MTPACRPDAALNHFSGLAPIFPLPNVVLFPQTHLPLHIFEPRYRQMTSDALEGERLIAMSLLRPGWDQFREAPPVHPIVGLGRIVADQRLDDGRFMLVLKGISRAKIVREEHVDLPYRIARLELCEDQPSLTPLEDQRRNVVDLIDLFCRLFPGRKFQQMIQQSLAEDLPLAVVCDVLASILPIASQLAQEFLDELNPDVRHQMLWQLLQRAERQQTTAMKRPFPPSFSRN